jgi:hypothetical protein
MGAAGYGFSGRAARPGLRLGLFERRSSSYPGDAESGAAHLERWRRMADYAQLQI